MLLKRLYKFNNRIWVKRVKNCGCSRICIVASEHSKAADDMGSFNESCKVGVCLTMLRKINSRNYRYIIKEYVAETKKN